MLSFYATVCVVMVKKKAYQTMILMVPAFLLTPKLISRSWTGGKKKEWGQSPHAAILHKWVRETNIWQT